MEVNWCVLYRKSCTYEFWNESHYVDHTKKSQERDMWKLLLKSWCLKYGGWWLYYSFESTLNSISIVHLAFFFFLSYEIMKISLVLHEYKSENAPEYCHVWAMLCQILYACKYDTSHSIYKPECWDQPVT